MPDRPARDADLLAFGAAVQRRRAALGWTLDDLARESNVSRRFIVDIEQGRANPSYITLLELAAALRVAAADLVAEAELDATESGYDA